MQYLLPILTKVNTLKINAQYFNFFPYAATTALSRGVILHCVNVIQMYRREGVTTLTPSI